MKSTSYTISGIEIEESILNMLTAELKQGMMICEKVLDTSAILEEEKPKLLSFFHKLKGSTGFIGLTKIEETSRKLEDLIRSDDKEYKNVLKTLRGEITTLLNEIELTNKES